MHYLRSIRLVNNTNRLIHVLLVAIIALTFSLLSLTSAPAQSTYIYRSYQVDIFIQKDTSLMVIEKVTYFFNEPQEWVGIFIPSSYGTVGMGMVMDSEGTPLASGQWDYERSEDGYTLMCYTGDISGEASFSYLYYIYGSLLLDDGSIGLEWSAVPGQRDSGIEESSVALHFPEKMNITAVELEASPHQYQGNIAVNFENGYTAYIEARDLAPESSYSFRCYWPASVMDLEYPAEPPSWAFEDASEKSWEFERFDSDITVSEDSSFTVRETQVVNFRGSFTFLNRDLSSQNAYYGEGRTYGRVRIRDVEVFNLDGQPYDDDLWSTDSHEGGVTVRIEFQAENQQMGWIISYRMTGALIFGPAYDRLYWNAVSQDRSVPIKSSRITVKLPPGAVIDEVKTDFYPDPYSPPSSYYKGREGGVLWWSATDIAPYTTITVDTSFPKGLVAIPWQYRSTCGIIAILFSVIFPLAVLAFMLALWWRKGRDTRAGSSTMVRYDPPEDLKPAMVGMLINERPRIEDVSATIVDLACRGKLSISEQTKEGWRGGSTYVFQRLDHDQSDLLPYERKIMDGLFEKGDVVAETDLVNEFYAHVNGILNKGVVKEVIKRHLFVKDPAKVRSGYYWRGILAATLPSAAIFTCNLWLDMGWLNLLAAGFILAGAAVVIIGRFMPRRSAEGSRALEQSLGFKDFLQTAEMPELEYMTPDNFQNNLPYAMVMGVEEQWAHKFQNIYTSPPDWYSGYHTDFSAMRLTSSLKSMTTSLSRTLTSSPSSSGGSGGGGFGGGSSGGGFGGGGSSAG